MTGYVRAWPLDTPPLKLSSNWRFPVERARPSVREAIYERVANRQLAGVLAALVWWATRTPSTAPTGFGLGRRRLQIDRSGSFFKVFFARGWTRGP